MSVYTERRLLYEFKHRLNVKDVVFYKISYTKKFIQIK